MTLRAYLLSTVSQPAIRTTMAPATAMYFANALAWAYGGLHLHHLDLKPQGRVN